jgi:Fe-S oxidoreductase
MALSDFQGDMETCCRCSACKFIPLENVKGHGNVNVCPSISRYNFHAYSGGGRLALGVAVLEKEIDYSEKLIEILYNCQMCGACDVSCKYAMDMDVLEPITAIRIDCVEKGHTLPVFDKMVSSMRQGGPLAPAKPLQGRHWFDALNARDYKQEKTEVVYHAGCRTAGNPAMWKTAQSTLKLLQKAGIDAGIAGAQEPCCGGRAYQMGYKADFLNQAKGYIQKLKHAGVRTLVTSCAECYHSFKVLYNQFNLIGSEPEVLHTTEYFARLIADGVLAPSNPVELCVTYHDPCHLGRLGEPYIHWSGKQIPGHIRLFDPPREFRRGTHGVYEAPRKILRSLPGLKLKEMDRTREYAWCCGAGGGVYESNPEFAQWTAVERLREAASTGANAVVSACPGCETLFNDCLKETGGKLQAYDVVELLAEAAL